MPCCPLAQYWMKHQILVPSSTPCIALNLPSFFLFSITLFLPHQGYATFPCFSTELCLLLCSSTPKHQVWAVWWASKWPVIWHSNDLHLCSQFDISRMPQIYCACTHHFYAADRTVEILSMKDQADSVCAITLICLCLGLSGLGFSNIWKPRKIDKIMKFSPDKNVGKKKLYAPMPGVSHSLIVTLFSAWVSTTEP